MTASLQPMDRALAEMLDLAIPITNEEFLRTIFGDDWGRAHVCAFAQDPTDKTTPREVWAGGHAAKRLRKFRETENHYVAISLFSTDAEGKPRRRKELFESTVGIVADDVHEKLPVELVEKLPTPTYKLRTSPESEQWGWRLNTPATDRQQVENLLDGLVKQGLAPGGKDPGMRGVTRYVRLPEGSNTKASRVTANGGAAPGCWISEWNPGRSVTLEELAAPFGIDLDAPRADSCSGTLVDCPDHPVLNHLNVKAKIRDGVCDITCPWLDEHTDEADNGAAVFLFADGSVGFECHHGHCEGRTGEDLIAWLSENAEGFLGEFEAFRKGIALKGFEAIPEETPEDRVARLMSCLVSPDEVEQLNPPPDVVEHIVPREEVTLLGGHGGVGKSVALLFLLICIATGRVFGPLATRQVPVLFFSAEDGRRVLASRLRRVCRVLGIKYADVAPKLHILDATDIDPTLFREKPTKLVDDLAEVARQLGVGLVAIDNSSDTFDDEENIRRRVRAFVRSLRRRVANPGRAVILLAHVDKNTARKNAGGTENYSGSTAWHNSVRSRLFLDRVKDGSLVLEHQKANYGPLAAPVRLDWVDGVPVPRGDFSDPFGDDSDLERMKAEQDRVAILTIITEFHQRGERVTTATTGPSTVYKLLHAVEGFPAVDRGQFNNILRELERAGQILRKTITTPDRKQREVFVPAAPMLTSAPMPTGEGVSPGGRESAHAA